MSEKRSPERIIGGSGTEADPFKVRNDLTWACNQIKGAGYDYEPARIADARRLVEEVDLTQERREHWTQRINKLEYQSRGARTGYLIRRHRETLKELEDLRTKTVKADFIKRKDMKAQRFFREAREAYQEFLAFADAHPELADRERDAAYFRSPDELLVQP